LALSAPSNAQERNYRVDHLFNRLVVVPSDPIDAYERAGYDWLERYYNPLGAFREVYLISPLERGTRQAYGMTIIAASAKDFQSQLRKVEPDVVRAYGGYWPADLVCKNRLPDVPVVVSVHDTNPELLHPSIAYADLVICMSRAIAVKVRALGTPPDRIRIMPNRVDLSVFRPITDETKLESLRSEFPSGKAILHVGRKTTQKNLETIIGALRILPPEYYAIFIGAGDERPYRTLADRAGVADRCYWKESVPNSDLPVWYSWAACMCTPSLWEGFGIVFIEAAACGGAIVTSDIAPMNEYLEKDVSACLVENFEDPKAIAQGIRKVCEDPEYRRTIQEGAIKAAQPFDRQRIDEQEIAIYREALAKPPRVLTAGESRALRVSTVAHLFKVGLKRLFSRFGRALAVTRAVL
jgi:glycosyltransferase involved in cell wall biosynthesis